MFFVLHKGQADIQRKCTRRRKLNEMKELLFTVFILVAAFSERADRQMGARLRMMC